MWPAPPHASYVPLVDLAARSAMGATATRSVPSVLLAVSAMKGWTFAPIALQGRLPLAVAQLFARTARVVLTTKRQVPLFVSIVRRANTGTVLALPSVWTARQVNSLIPSIKRRAICARLANSVVRQLWYAMFARLVSSVCRMPVTASCAKLASSRLPHRQATLIAFSATAVNSVLLGKASARQRALGNSLWRERPAHQSALPALSRQLDSARVLLAHAVLSARRHPPHAPCLLVATLSTQVWVLLRR